MQLSIFEKQLKDIDSVGSLLEDGIVPHVSQSQESSIVEGIAPKEILELFEKLPKTFDSFSIAQNNEIMTVFEATSKL